MGTHNREFRRRFFLLCRRIALLAAILGTGGPAAASILLLPSPEPDEWSDISISSVIGMYSGGMFIVMGTASGFDVGPGSALDFTFAAQFDITAAIDPSGNVSSGGLTIGPPSSNLGPPGSYPTSSPLLHGTITDAQFETPGVLQLEFIVTSGSAAGDFGGVGALGGVIINIVSGTNFPGSPVVLDPMTGPPAAVSFNSPANGPDDFVDAFTITQGSTADVIGGAIPEPSAWMVWSAIVGCVLLAKHVSRAHNSFAALWS